MIETSKYIEEDPVWGNIYDEDTIEEYLDCEGISNAEEAFMMGYLSGWKRITKWRKRWIINKSSKNFYLYNCRRPKLCFR